MAKKAYEFGPFLKRLREKKGVSLKDAEIATGIPNAYLSQLETGSRKKLPQPDRLRLIADYYNVSVQELLTKAGYYESKEVKETYEQKIEKAFLHAINDPRFSTGSRIKPDELPLDAKRYILEMYSYNVRKSLLFKRPFPSGTLVNKNKVKTLSWRTDSVKRETHRAGDRLIVRYRVRVTCIESEGEFDDDKIYYEGPKAGTEKITQTAIGDGVFEEDATDLKGYESLLLIQASDNAVKNALRKIKGTKWTSVVKPFGE